MELYDVPGLAFDGEYVSRIVREIDPVKWIGAEIRSDVGVAVASQHSSSRTLDRWCGAGNEFVFEPVHFHLYAFGEVLTNGYFGAPGWHRPNPRVGFRVSF